MKRNCLRCNREFGQSVQIFCSSRCIVIDYFLSIGKVQTIEDAKKFAEEIFSEYYNQFSTGD